MTPTTNVRRIDADARATCARHAPVDRPRWAVQDSPPGTASGRRNVGDSSPVNQLNRRRTTMKKPTASPVDAAASLALMRVTAVHRTTVQLHDGRAERSARVLPRLLRGDGGAALAVGDWALAGADGARDLWLRARVEPSSHIARRDGDGSRHPIVSNVDCALLVMGLDDDFNLRRLERYLSLVFASRVAPVVVLSKADIAAAEPRRRDQQVAQLRARLTAGVEVVIVDGTDRHSAASFAHLTGFGRTLVV